MSLADSLFRTTIRRSRRLALAVSIAASCVSAPAWSGSGPAATATPHLPDSAVGKLAGELIRHIGGDGPDGIRQWAPGLLSDDIDPADKQRFIDLLASSARESGGLDVFDVRTDPRQPGLLEVAVKARHGGRRGLFVLAADEARPDRLAMADLVPMPDPGLYADWPKGAVSRADMQRLIHAALDRLAQTEDFSGCVTVFDGRQTAFDECRGLAERNFKVPVDERTKFSIASIGKMFTAVAVAQQVEAGKLSWNTTLAEALPEYPDRAMAGKITVWQLLHHTAGLGGDFLVPEFFEHRKEFIDPADYLDLIAHQPKDSEPGTHWSYSNTGYILLGRIVEKVSGENYFDYIRRHVFVPAGMTDSGFNRLEDVTPRLATGYFRDGPFATDWKADWIEVPFMGSPAGDGYSTNADLLRFAAALRAGKLVELATLAKMFDGEVPADGPGAYGAGFSDRVSHGRHLRGHTGGLEGTTANLAMVWETGAAVALTSNQGISMNWLLAEHIADLLAAEGAGD